MWGAANRVPPLRSLQTHLLTPTPSRFCLENIFRLARGSFGSRSASNRREPVATAIARGLARVLARE